MHTPTSLSAMRQQDTLLKLALGYQVSQVLSAAVSLDIFTHLQGTRMDLRGIAGILQIDERVLRRFITALLDLDLLQESDGYYSNTTLSSRYLVKGESTYMGNLIHHAINLWDFWVGLEQKLAGPECCTPDQHCLDDFSHRLDDYLAAMDDSARLKAAIIAEALSLDGISSILDLGCGPATYAIFFAEKFEHLKATLVDIEPNLAFARERISCSSASNRIRTVNCQILEDDLPFSDYDLVFISNLLHIYDTYETDAIVRKGWNSLIAPGKIVIHDYFFTGRREDSRYVSLLDLSMLLGTPRGRCYYPDELEELLKRLGARRVTLLPVSLGTALIVGEK